MANDKYAPLSPASIVKYAVPMLMGLAILVESWRFVRMAVYFAHFPPVGDSRLYLAVGRSLLNGLQLYTDLFESKPPIIFWLTALSLRVGMPSLYIWLQILALALVGPMIALFVYGKTRDGLGAACGGLLGVIAAFELLTRTFGYQLEGFGAPVALAAVLLFAFRRTSVATIASGIAVGVAAMLKEPFAVSAALGMLVFCEDRKDMARLGRVLCIGAVAALAILLLSGGFHSYLTVYLPEMLSGRRNAPFVYPDFADRVSYLIPAPLWVRGLNMYKLFTTMGSPLFMLPVIFLVCLCLFVPCKTRTGRRSLIISGLTFASFIYAAHQVFVLYELVTAIRDAGSAVPWHDPILEHLVLGATMPLLLFGGLFFLRTDSALLLTATCLGLFVTAILVSYGGDYVGQYIGFALPPLIAVAVVCLLERKYDLLLAAILLCAVCIPGEVGMRERQYAIAPQGVPIAQAAALDSVMDRCSVERYFMAGGAANQSLSAYTVHSPYQIYYGLLRAVGGLVTAAPPNPFFAAKFDHDLNQAKIIVIGDKDDPTVAAVPLPATGVIPMDVPVGSQVPKSVVTELRNFTDVPPSCATGVTLHGLKVYFRKA